MGWENIMKRRKTGIFSADEQTGKVFELETENPVDIFFAIVSVCYLLAMLIFLGWLFIDIYTARMYLFGLITNGKTESLNSETFQIIAYTIIGGGIGGVINGFRSVIGWHPEKRAFGWRHVWKYIILPFLGAAMAILIYAILRSGSAVIGLDFKALDSKTNVDAAIRIYSAFAIGSLSGYGSHQAFRWLDKKTAEMFKVNDIPLVSVPNLIGKTKDEAEKILQDLKLNRGKVTFKSSHDASMAGKIFEQHPHAGIMMPQAAAVDIVVAKEAVESPK